MKTAVQLFDGPDTKYRTVKDHYKLCPSKREYVKVAGYTAKVVPQKSHYRGRVTAIENMRFVAAAKDARLANKISQVDLCERIGLTRSQLVALERGITAPTLAVALRLCAILGLDIRSFGDNQ